MKDLLEKIADEMNGRNDIPMTEDLENAFSGLSNLTWMDKDEEDCLLGTVYIFNVPHHVTFVRVVYDEQTFTYVATKDPYQRLDNVLRDVYEGLPQTVELPGLEGEWVVGIDPFRR